MQMQVGRGILAATIVLACSNNDSQGELGGSTDVAFSAPGNVISSGTITAGGVSLSATASMQVISNDSGVATMHLTADFANSPELTKYNALIPAKFKDSSGRIDTNVDIRVTSEGIQDTLNRDEAFFTLVKYGSPVGDTYKLTKSNGVTVTRTVTAKSEVDDFPYGLYNIKTMTIEQDSRIPGVKKLVFRANHKFGVVHFQVVAEDGSTAETYLYSAN